MIDQRLMKLGKKAAKFDPKTPRLGAYFKALPAPPASQDWTKGITSWGMMLNDSLGDCTIAACGHALQVWTANVGIEITVPDSEIQKYYEYWDGYNPADPSTDQGGVELDVLNDWRADTFAGHKLIAYADPDVTNHTHVMQGIQLFGGVYIGLALPITAQNQAVWDVVGDPTDPSSDSYPGSWGGHAVFVPKYESASGLTCITWGALQPMTWNFWNTYVDEVHALLAGCWMENVTAPSGFDMAQLEIDIKEVAA